jgi:hypothetical protein
MYGVVTTVPAPVEMYGGMHAEIHRRVGSAPDGLLVHIGRAWGSYEGKSTLGVDRSRSDPRQNASTVLCCSPVSINRSVSRRLRVRRVMSHAITAPT